MSAGGRALAGGAADLAAFLRHRADVPAARGAALAGSLGALRASEDPVVTFGGLPGACVPAFADGCQVELSDHTGPLVRVSHPASGPGPDQAAERMLLTPFQAASRAGYPPYAGLITHWWDGRAPGDSDAAIAGLLVHHLTALVDHERLMAALARAEDQAASLALQAIAGRTITLAAGIIMHQYGVTPDQAEILLRQSAKTAGTSLAQMAITITGTKALPDPAPPRNQAAPSDHNLVLLPHDPGDPGDPADATEPCPGAFHETSLARFTFHGRFNDTVV
jgi:hypothetical protein